MAEEASKELMIHSFFLQGLERSHVLEAYRSCARETHPDAGGSVEAFAAVDRAKHVLLEWLKKSPAPAEPAHGTKCNQCGGAGFIMRHRGLRAMRMQCPRCRGMGETDVEIDEGDGR